MTRETSMERYNKLRKLEGEYESAKSQIKSYSSMEFTTVLLFLVLSTLPIKQIKRILFSLSTIQKWQKLMRQKL